MLSEEYSRVMRCQYAIDVLINEEEDLDLPPFIISLIMLIASMKRLELMF